jgi:hypothetical protein
VEGEPFAVGEQNMATTRVGQAEGGARASIATAARALVSF